MKQILILGFSLLFAIASLAQSVHYEFKAPNAVHHEAIISVTATKVPDGPAYFRMSRSSPGRYAKHEFGKNVYNVQATDGKGNGLKVEKTDADIYMIPKHDGSITVTYTLFANHADGTYASVDATGYHLNMPATFMWVQGMDQAPISIAFSYPNKAWKIATQLKPAANDTSFTASGLQYFMDSPTKIGDLQMREWQDGNPGQKAITFRLALESDAPAVMVDIFAAKVQKMVKEAKAVFGEYPAYDYGTYTFIASINPWVKGDGMEHRNSTMITIPRNFDGSNTLLGVFSHEFFHCWNVERIRPADLEPFDFTKSNMSEGLWLAEGFTQYYGDIILKRASLINEKEFWGEMARLVNTKMNTPGAQGHTPIENSQRAVFVDAGVAIDKTNYGNMYSSYYTYGGAVAFALDMEIRNQFPGKSLDNFMRELWKRFGKTGTGYKVSDLEPALAAVTSPTFASEFFNRYIFGSQPYDYAQPLQKAGVELKPVSTAANWIGNVYFETVIGGLQVKSPAIVNTPFYNAGIDVDDIILSVNGLPTNNVALFENLVSRSNSNSPLKIEFLHRGKQMTTTIRPIINPEISIKPLSTGMSQTQRSQYDSWLSPGSW